MNCPSKLFTEAAAGLLNGLEFRLDVSDPDYDQQTESLSIGLRGLRKVIRS